MWKQGKCVKMFYVSHQLNDAYLRTCSWKPFTVASLVNWPCLIYLTQFNFHRDIWQPNFQHRSTKNIQSYLEKKKEIYLFTINLQQTKSSTSEMNQSAILQKHITHIKLENLETSKWKTVKTFSWASFPIPHEQQRYHFQA